MSGSSADLFCRSAVLPPITTKSRGPQEQVRATVLVTWPRVRTGFRMAIQRGRSDRWRRRRDMPPMIGLRLFRSGGFTPPFSRCRHVARWRGKLAATMIQLRRACLILRPQAESLTSLLLPRPPVVFHHGVYRIGPRALCQCPIGGIFIGSLTSAVLFLLLQYLRLLLHA